MKERCAVWILHAGRLYTEASVMGANISGSHQMIETMYCLTLGVIQTDHESHCDSQESL